MPKGSPELTKARKEEIIARLRDPVSNNELQGNNH